jgi:hypothetical protein
VVDSVAFSTSATGLPLAGDDELGRLYRYWDDLRAGRPLPDRRDLRPDDFRAFLGWVNLFNVADEPRTYRIRLHGTDHVRLEGRDLHGQDSTAIRPAAYRALVTGQYDEVVATRRPSRHRIVLRFDRHEGAYQRITLPFTDGGEAVRILMTATSHTPEILALLRLDAYRRFKERSE